MDMAVPAASVSASASASMRHLQTSIPWSRCSLYSPMCHLPFRVHATAANDVSAECENIPKPLIKEDRTSDMGLQLHVRGANLGDYWEVADIHCSAFFPELGSPMDMILRLDRVLALIGGSTIPSSRKRSCLVAFNGQTDEGLRHVGFSLGDIWSLAWKGLESHEVHVDKVLGILTVDTMAEYLPRRRPTGLRRMGIAYISNVAVRQRLRRRGIARKLVREAERIATQWGCRSIALHCDIRNPGAFALYLGAGYKLVPVPIGAKWPQPKASSGSEFCLMMKRLPPK